MFSKKDMKGLQQKYQELTQQVEQMEVEGHSAGNLVKVTLNGKMELLSIQIQPTCVDPQDVTLLQDLILAAYKEAQNKVQSKMSQIMPSMPGMGF